MWLNFLIFSTLTTHFNRQKMSCLRKWHRLSQELLNQTYRHVCTHFGAFFMQIPNMAAIIHNYQIFENFLGKKNNPMCWLPHSENYQSSTLQAQATKIKPHFHHTCTTPSSLAAKQGSIVNILKKKKKTNVIMYVQTFCHSFNVSNGQSLLW